MATLATLATLGADLLKNSPLGSSLDGSLSPHLLYPFLFFLFSRFNLGVAKVAKVAVSQKSHKVRVERSGATLGRRRVVNLLTQVRVYPRAGGARALPDVGRCSTWCRDPPSHVLHARRARRWRARVSRRRGGRPGGGTQRARLAIGPMCAP